MPARRENWLVCRKTIYIGKGLRRPLEFRGIVHNVEKNMNRQALDNFGRFLVTQVRDKAILQWEGLLTGRLKGTTAQYVKNSLSEFTPEEVKVLQKLIPKIVDTTLHHLLWSLEQDKFVSISIKTDTEVIADIREISDGLAGELPDWIPKFSKEILN